MKKNEITYYWGDRSLLIRLGNRTDKRVRALYIAELIFTGCMATIFMLQAMPLRHSTVHIVACVGASAIFMLAAYRFLSRIFYDEQLLLDQRSLTIIRKTFFGKNIRKYDWREIGALHYEGKPKKADHPLKGHSFDYLGFDTQDHLIQSLHHNGNMYFDSYEGRVYFASGVYSWNAEEMVQLMKLYIGSSLQLGPEWKEMLQEQGYDD